MNYKRSFGKRSIESLTFVHPKLLQIVHRALELSVTDFSVIEGHRGRIAQETAYKLGNTKVQYPNSAHNQMPSLAVDLIPYPFKSWNDIEGFKQIADAMFQAAAELECEIRWGGDFNRDGDKTKTDAWDKPHFELHPWRKWKGK